MEIALACCKRATVSVVGREQVPFELILGQAVGAGIQKHHESTGTKFYLPADLSHITASTEHPDSVGGVVLKDGTVIPADIVVLGVGVKPATAVFKNSGFTLQKDGGVEVDGYLRVKEVAKGNVFAIGDIATYPDHQSGDLIRVEHWNVASVGFLL